jgi:hypothetical protein
MNLVAAKIAVATADTPLAIAAMLRHADIGEEEGSKEEEEEDDVSQLLLSPVSIFMADELDVDSERDASIRWRVMESKLSIPNIFPCLFYSRK